MNANEYLHKAERTLAAARVLLDNGDAEGACNRAYYAMFDAAHAALLASGAGLPEAQTRTHRGLIGAFGLHFRSREAIPSPATVGDPGGDRFRRFF